MNIAAFPLRRSTPLANAEACALRCALFAAQADDKETAMALCAASGQYAKRYLQLAGLGVRR